MTDTSELREIAKMYENDRSTTVDFRILASAADELDRLRAWQSRVVSLLMQVEGEEEIDATADKPVSKGRVSISREDWDLIEAAALAAGGKGEG